MGSGSDRIGHMSHSSIKDLEGTDRIHRIGPEPIGSDGMYPIGSDWVRYIGSDRTGLGRGRKEILTFVDFRQKSCKSQNSIYQAHLRAKSTFLSQKIMQKSKFCGRAGPDWTGSGRGRTGSGRGREK